MSAVGKYQIVRRIASGGMAEVFLAKAEGPQGFEKTVALKQILPHLADDPKFIQMFFQEARIAAQLNHPNIIQIFDFGQAQGTFFIAMELIDGPTLRGLERRAKQAQMEIPPPLCAKIVSLACEGLAYAHEFVSPQTGQRLDLIHRDLSPDNILISRSGAVKLVDFGIAKATTSLPVAERTRTGIVKGKIGYMAPEQMDGKSSDARGDIYSMGVVLYELLTGRRPFEADNEIAMMRAILENERTPISEAKPSVPAALVRVVERATARDPNARYQTCRALQTDLEQFVIASGKPASAQDIAALINRVVAAVPEARKEFLIGTPTAPSAMPGGWEEVAASDLKTAYVGDVTADVSWRPPHPPRPPPRGPRTRTWWMWPPALALVAAAAWFWLPGPPPPSRGVQAPAPPKLPPSSPPPVPVEPPKEVAVASAPEATKSPERPARPKRREGGPRAVHAPAPKAEPPLFSVEFRIRPYGNIYLDGKDLGMTPLAPVPLTQGKHTARVTNTELGKEITKDFEVGPGLNVFRYNFEE